MPKAWHLVSRPDGLPSLNNLELREAALPPLGPDEVRVRNQWLSVDPITRLRIGPDTPGGHPSFPIGGKIEGVAIGRVTESHDPSLQVGDIVKHQLGWRDEAVGAATAFSKLPDFPVPPQYFLHYMGVVGFTAWSGLAKTAHAEAGETAFISAAAGGVGSAAVQIAKVLGLRVVASAGGNTKCAYVRSIGADEVIDYKAAGSLLDKLRAAAPEGVDVYLDNVGGDHLDAALAVANPHARIAVSGAIGNYHGGEPAMLHHLARIILKNVRIEGFIAVREHGADMAAFQQLMAGWIAEGKVKPREVVFEGIESTAAAFISIFSGDQPGKILVRI